ncbi:hypothetical protein MCU_00723 [Bartonella elizabethae Re6043vi]|uniref:Uncharacterized protein n=2 Tax=Bartonella elizabethae TaxID=807 RepID=J0RM85_BAREL|nr:DUF1376 domain-containing protein [Bartonella elizabethae]EJF84055.1 hypothetical protein MCU_00723 [Bartonella elizabethae Re6043vi]EJF96704.1 hypothetical protein MEE_00603 [Bartonella elizabethae F9251 = ATCC 49927]VEJ40168.1 Uncharacterized protein conserved in bacteria [Bartonella elizabethae]
MSSKLPWTRLFADKWLLDLAYLPPFEGFIYVKLRFQMLRTGEPLTNNFKVLSLLAGCSVKRFQKALDLLLETRHIICLEDGRLWNPDVELELNDSKEKSEAASKAANSRWHKTKGKNDDKNESAYADCMQSVCDAHSVAQCDRNAININNNIYNKKTNTIVLAKKEIGSENLETTDLVEEPTEDDALKSQSEQIETSSENKPLIHEQESVPKKAKRTKANRGCRIPADFEPDYDFALAEGLPPERVKVEMAKFQDYWRSKAGANATKIDWQATWRNWVRNSKKYEINDNGGNNGNFSKDQGTRGGTGETIRNLICEAGFSDSTSKYCTTDGAMRHKGVSMDLDQWHEINTSTRGTSFCNLSDSSKLTYLESVC